MCQSGRIREDTKTKLLIWFQRGRLSHICPSVFLLSLKGVRLLGSAGGQGDILSLTAGPWTMNSIYICLFSKRCDFGPSETSRDDV